MLSSRHARSALFSWLLAGCAQLVPAGGQLDADVSADVHLRDGSGVEADNSESSEVGTDAGLMRCPRSEPLSPPRVGRACAPGRPVPTLCAAWAATPYYGGPELVGYEVLAQCVLHPSDGEGGGSCVAASRCDGFDLATCRCGDGPPCGDRERCALAPGEVSFRCHCRLLTE